MEENKKLQKQTEALNKKVSAALLTELKGGIINVNGIDLIAAKVDADTSVCKNMAFGLLRENKNMLVVLANADGGKAFLTVAAGEELIANKNIHAGNIIRELAKEIKGGGGGQPHFATAGGKDPSGIAAALEKVKEIL